MTTANIMDVSKVSGSVSQVKGSVKAELEKKTKEIASEMFGSFMSHLSGSMSDGQSKGKDPVSVENTVGKSDYGTADLKSQNKAIARTSDDPVTIRVREKADTVQETGKQIVETVSRQLQVPEEEVEEMLDQLGLTAFDLLDPAKLGLFVGEFKSITDPSALLMDQDFTQLLTDLGQTGKELLKELGVKPDQMSELISRMDVLETPQDLPGDQFSDILRESVETKDTAQSDEAATPVELKVETDGKSEDVATTDGTARSVWDDASPEPETGNGMTADEKALGSIRTEDRPTGVVEQEPARGEAVEEKTVSAKITGSSREEQPVEQEKIVFQESMAGETQEVEAAVNEPVRTEAAVTEKEPVPVPQKEVAEEEPETEELIRRLLADEKDEPSSGQKEAKESFGDDRNPAADGRAYTNTGINHEQTVSLQPAAEENLFRPEPQPQVEVPQSYTSFDTAELINQVVRNITTSVERQITTMEMQLNPEHLGKLLVHLTAKEGAVSAQFMAANEEVRAALETQIATIRENLSQAGVRVDSIEVTVEAHEFEQNLEQNARGEEEAARQQEEQNRRGHRNINIDSLDDLSGLMSDEERLAAQIMMDNGNSMDVTA